MSECTNCGTQLEEDFLRCPECGVSVDRTEGKASSALAETSTAVLDGNSGRLGHVTITEGPGKGRSFQLGSETYIGRSRRETQIYLDDSAVSRRHGLIRKEAGRFVYFDMGSSNGSRLVTAQGHQQPVKGSAPLQDGDELIIGSARLLFRESGN